MIQLRFGWGMGGVMNQNRTLPGITIYQSGRPLLPERGTDWVRKGDGSGPDRRSCRYEGSKPSRISSLPPRKLLAGWGGCFNDGPHARDGHPTGAVTRKVTKLAGKRPTIGHSPTSGLFFGYRIIHDPYMFKKPCFTGFLNRLCIPSPPCLSREKGNWPTTAKRAGDRPNLDIPFEPPAPSPSQTAISGGLVGEGDLEQMVHPSPAPAWLTETFTRLKGNLPPFTALPHPRPPEPAHSVPGDGGHPRGGLDLEVEEAGEQADHLPPAGDLRGAYPCSVCCPDCPTIPLAPPRARGPHPVPLLCLGDPHPDQPDG